jgi:hypothetical protein
MTVRNSARDGIWRLFLAATLALSMTDSTQALSQDRSGETASSLREEVSRIENDPDPQSRYEAMRQVVGALRNDSSGIVENDVVALSELLRDTNDMVRDRAAVALGLIGPRAMHAVPALRTALDEVECVRADQNSSSAIRIALHRIGVEPTPPECIATPNYGLKPRRPAQADAP